MVTSVIKIISILSGNSFNLKFIAIEECDSPLTIKRNPRLFVIVIYDLVFFFSFYLVFLKNFRVVIIGRISIVINFCMFALNYNILLNRIYVIWWIYVNHAVNEY